MNKDFKEFITLLNSNNVHYLIVGGYAVAFHGHPRYTKDLDVWIWAEPGNAEKLIKVIKEFGFDSLDLLSNDFTTPDTIIQLGYPPNRIDIITGVSGLEFEHCYPKRVEFTIDDIVINFIDLENLKKNKRATGRFQDMADLENLE